MFALLCHVVAASMVLNAAPRAPLPPLKAAVIVPGFLSDAKDFEDLATLLTERGIPTAVVPFPLWCWLPQIGGRSVRLVLDRLEHTVRHVAALGDDAHRSQAPITVPPIEYGVADLWRDFWTNPGGVAEVGGSAYPDEYPTDVSPAGRVPAPIGEPCGRVAIIGHSAGGWISRIFLSDRAYGGKAYCGAELVHSLVTIGTPHKVGMGVPFYSVEWINREPFPAERVDGLAVGGRGTRGDSNSVSSGAYSFCTPDGRSGDGLDGDGLTTLDSAIGLDGVETRVLDGVTHYPWTAAPFADQLIPELAAAYREGTPWYGSEAVLDQWLPWLIDRMPGEKSPESSQGD